MTRILFTVLIGATVPRPAPSALAEAIERTEITQTDEGRSGFQITLKVGRSDGADLLDYALLQTSLLEPFNRVILMAVVNAQPTVLMDGVITQQELLPSNEPGESRLIVTGEDVSVMMDLEEKIVAHPAQNAAMIATKIIASYAKYGLVPKIMPPLADRPPLPIDRIPVQHDTDLAYLQRLAQRHGYVFYVSSPVPGVNTAYWGPPPRLGIPQPALSVNLGSFTNVESIQFRYDSLAATLVQGHVQDRETNRAAPIQTESSLRLPLARNSALRSQTQLRRVLPAIDRVQNQAAAQAVTDASLDRVVVAEGELEVMQYGHILQARGLVGVRGVGDSYSGSYYVKRVTHIFEQGNYRQRFRLVREGLGALTPLVRP